MPLKIPGLRKRNVGATGRAYAAGLRDVCEVKANVSEHGYVLKLSAAINYNMLNDREAARIHGLILQVVSEAIRDSGEQRRVNVPLFDTAELALTGTTEGINER